MAAYARQAKNRDLEADAVEIRMRATRRLDQLRQAQKDTIGLSAGTRGSRVKGARVDDKPTLASQGIDKNLAHQARVLGAMDEAAFERKVTEARESASRVYRRVVREAEIAQEREETAHAHVARRQRRRSVCADRVRLPRRCDRGRSGVAV